MNAEQYAACDLGADSGRVILGTLSGGKLELEEIHRFRNGPVQVAGSLHWNILGIFAELKEGLRKIGERGKSVAGVSVDSWGVDYVYRGEGQPILSIPFHYRDARTDEAYPETVGLLGKEKIFSETGLQFMPFNTIYQLADDRKRSPGIQGMATDFLGIADFLNYLFSGVARMEESLASTTQIYHPAERKWSGALIEALGLPAHIFPEVVPSGTVLGPLDARVAAEVGLGGAQVIATCSHDTGAAVAAAPGEGEDWAYLSSGTWSLMGVELEKALMVPEVLARNFTNEIGYGGTIRFLKNITGMWLVQESRRAWEKEGLRFTFDELDGQALEAEPFRSFILPSSQAFMKPGEMPKKIAAFCAETGQPVPETPGQVMRCILDSLALGYRSVLEELEALTGKTLRRVHVVGGGSKNRVLNQFAANATGREFHAGPVEATAIGNCLIQALALGRIGSLAALRKVVRDSFPLDIYRPEGTGEWSAAFGRFRELEARAAK
jgi:rhamnulokinase